MGFKRGGATFLMFWECDKSACEEKRKMDERQEGKKDNVKKGCVFEESRASAREMKKTRR